MADCLFMATIPAIGKIITASRKTEDMWAGSVLVSYLLKNSLKEIKNKFHNQVKFIFPYEGINFTNTRFADITNKILLKVENASEENIKKLAESLDYSIKENLQILCNYALEGLKVNQTEWKGLALYQAENSIELFWSAIKLSGDYQHVRTYLESYLGYLKDAKVREDKRIQGYKLIEPMTVPGSFDDFIKIDKSIEYCMGAYTCSVCTENTIIGATKADVKGKGFWEKIWKENRDKVKASEKLCGFCLLKRYLSEKLNIYGFPSTSEIATTDFKIKLLEKSEILELLTDILNPVKNKLPHGNLVPALGEKMKNHHHKDILSLDGEWFMVDTWNNPDKYEGFDISEDIAQNISQKLNDLYKAEIFYPSEMYAILRLDGDRMGAKISALKEDGHTQLSKLESEFVHTMDKIVKENSGITVYTGGDELLALIPNKTSLDCAKEINRKFTEHMRPLRNDLPEAKEYNFTLTGTLVIAHHLLPLQYVLNELFGLEKKAKETRDCIAIKFIKHSLSSEEVILKWEDIKKLRELSSIPRAFIYAIGSISNIFDSEDGLKEPKARQALIRSLLKRKISKEQIEPTVDALLDIDDKLNFLNLKSLLRIREVIDA
jgi:CRISPR-associated protein Cmr2